MSLNHAVGSLLGWISTNINSRNRHIASTNIEICFPLKEVDWRNSLLKKSLRENSKTLLESLWLWRNSTYALSKLCGDITNQHLLDEANTKNQGTIFVTPHFGSWEYAGLLTASCCDLMILYAPPKIKYLHQLSYHGRSSTGAQLIETTSVSLKTLIAHLKQGGSIGVLPDQVPSGNGGVYAKFFNRLAYTSTLVSKLASKYQCNVVFCYSLRRNKPSLHYDSFYYAAPQQLYDRNEQTSAQALNKFIENCVLQTPEQYLWSYKRFKSPAPTDDYPYKKL